MIYILEGPNGAGKTTLAKYLVKEYDFAYHKDLAKGLALLPAEYRLTATKEAIMAQARLFVSIAKKCNLVVDRFHLTEFVYGAVVRKYAVNYISEVEALMNEAYSNIFLVYVKDTLDNLIRRSNNVDVSKLLVNYDYIFEQSVLKKVKIPSLDMGSGIVMELLGLKYNGVPFIFTGKKEEVK